MKVMVILELKHTISNGVMRLMGNNRIFSLSMASMSFGGIIVKKFAHQHIDF